MIRHVERIESSLRRAEVESLAGLVLVYVEPPIFVPFSELVSDQLAALDEVLSGIGDAALRERLHYHNDGYWFPIDEEWASYFRFDRSGRSFRAHQ